MDVGDCTAEQNTFEAEIQRNFRWNLIANVLDGAFFWFGINFAASGTILPLYVRRLTDSKLLIGLVATIASAGWYLPQLFTARLVERLPRKKPVVINIGFFAERVPLAGMAASAFLFAARSPARALFTFYLTLAWLNVGAGVVAVAWQEMFAKVIPVQYRGRVFGAASFIGTATGILGATLAASILDRYPFPTNFGLCFFLAFVFILLSWASLALTREPPLTSRKPTHAAADYWRFLPKVLQADRSFALYLVARVVTMLGRLGMGFLTVFAVERWQLADSQAGLFTTAGVIGQAVANLVFGALADRRGHKLVLEISLMLGVAAMIGALWAPSLVWMYGVFVAVGSLSAADILSMLGIVMEFTGPEDRPTYMGLANTIPGLFAAVAPMIGGWMVGSTSYSATFVTGALLSSLALAILHYGVREPRDKPQPSSTL